MPDTGLSREPTVFRAKIAIIGEGYVGATFRVRASVRAGTMDVAVGSDILVIAADPNQLATAAGVSFDGADRDRIAAEVRGAAYEIIEGKGATYYAIASGLVRIARRSATSVACSPFRMRSEREVILPTSRASG